MGKGGKRKRHGINLTRKIPLTRERLNRPFT